MRNFLIENVINAFETTISLNYDDIYNTAINYTLDDWKSFQISNISNTFSFQLPTIQLISMAMDISFLMNRMAVCAYGIGAIIGYNKGLGNILEEEDFAVILAKWSDPSCVTNATLTKILSELVGKVGSKLATKKLSEFTVNQTGILIGKKLCGKYGSKIGSKIGPKLSAKGIAGWIPFAEPIINGGIILHFISEISIAAIEWYEIKIKY